MPVPFFRGSAQWVTMFLIVPVDFVKLFNAKNCHIVINVAVNISLKV